MGVADVVGHIEGYLHRQFDEAAELPVAVPGDLVDELLDAVLLDGIYVLLLLLIEATEDLCGARRVAVVEVAADDLLTMAIDVS